MASSPTDEAFLKLASIYAEGFEASLADDLARLGSLLTDADEVIAQLPPRADGPTSAAQQRAADAWRRLEGALNTAMDETRVEMAQLRSNKKVARAYGTDKRASGLRHNSHV